MRLIRGLPLLLLLLAATAAAAGPADDLTAIDRAVRTIRSIGPRGENGAAAAAEARRLGERLPPESVPDLLAAFGDLNPLAENLMRSAVESIADRAAAARKPLPTAALDAFVRDTKNDPRARRLGYELLVKADPSAADRLIPGLLTDPNADFRRDAVARLLDEADALEKAGKADEAKPVYEKALTGAVHDDQVQRIVKALEKRGVTVDPKRHFGFVTEWRAAGPFDNRGEKGFAAVYPPETEATNFSDRYDGQLGEVVWRPIAGNKDGAVDVGETFENWKGSATYLTTTFESDADREAEVRLSTPNSWKLWVNGEFAFGREEYHRGMTFDQYRVPVRLKAGENVFLLKLLQNEQDEDWAQGYTFRLRVTDAGGSAILPAGSPR